MIYVSQNRHFAATLSELSCNPISSGGTLLPPTSHLPARVLSYIMRAQTCLRKSLFRRTSGCLPGVGLWTSAQKPRVTPGGEASFLHLKGGIWGPVAAGAAAAPSDAINKTRTPCIHWAPRSFAVLVLAFACFVQAPGLIIARRGKAAVGVAGYGHQRLWLPSERGLGRVTGRLSGE